MTNNYFLKYPKSTLSKARKLRRNMTEAERKLWRLLRGNRLGVHFRRQVPLGPYVLDFLCLPAKLVVELDGSQHYHKTGLAFDSKRDAYLQAKGLKVLRFNNTEFFTNPSGVMQSIYEHIQKELSTS
jgi:very-short-patch-repair endonuclease